MTTGAPSEPATLVEVLSRGRQESIEPGQADPIEERLERFCQAAEAAYPAICRPRPVFVAALADKITSIREVEHELDKLSAGELYLAAALVAGDPAAAACFERDYLTPTRPALLRVGLSDTDVKDVQQSALAKLLVASGSKPARIWEYAGQGRLKGLVLVVATREAVSLRRRRVPEPIEEDVLWGRAGPQRGADIEAMRHQCAPALRAAITSALAGLSPRERNILRLHYVDGLRVERIALLYRVHRVSASRWISKARDRIAQRTRSELSRRLRLTPDEVESMVRLVQSQIDLSLERVLGEMDSDTPRGGGPPG